MIVFKYQPMQAKIFPVSKKNNTQCAKNLLNIKTELSFTYKVNSVESFIEKNNLCVICYCKNKQEKQRIFPMFLSLYSNCLSKAKMSFTVNSIFANVPPHKFICCYFKLYWLAPWIVEFSNIKKTVFRWSKKVFRWRKMKSF
jgi:hypothetical protein